jgi:hypothetical protein
VVRAWIRWDRAAVERKAAREAYDDTMGVLAASAREFYRNLLVVKEKNDFLAAAKQKEENLFK